MPYWPSPTGSTTPAILSLLWPRWLPGLNLCRRGRLRGSRCRVVSLALPLRGAVEQRLEIWK
eukprot:7319792-Alexandrium_andersonii.AAC.1